ncbi:MAG: glycoside hydrolase family 28 protein [Spirochaetales bacterium]|nr:glycoside hydrolase family 28 protein [Spirochaetales bacterium]
MNRYISEFGAVADGKFLNTEIINNAIAETAGKDAIVFASGVYLTGPIDVVSGSHIIFEEGAVLSFVDDFAAYPPVMTRWEGVDCYAMHPLVGIMNADNVIIEGPGIIDGNGRKWWDYIFYRRAEQPEPVLDVEKAIAKLNPNYKNQPGGGGGRQCQFLRPPLMQIYKSNNVKLSGFTLTNSPFWTLHPVYSNHLEIDSVKVINPYDTPNTDGIDIESSSYVTIKNSYVDVGDDGIAMKSGSGDEGIKAGIPTSHIEMINCTVKHAHGGFVIGSETAAGVHDVFVKGCKFLGTDRGVRIKTRRGRGGKIHSIRVEDTYMEDVICPVTVNMYYRWGSNDPVLYSLEKQEINEATPMIWDISLKGLVAENCRASAGFIVGLPEAPVKNFVIEDCSFLLSETPEDGLEIEMYNGIPESSYRGIRVRNAELKISSTNVNVSPAYQIEC